MSMPKIPDINPYINLDREDVVNVIIASIAMEELALAHILNAEGEKLQYVLGTLDSKRDPIEVTICDVMAVNESIQKTLRDVIKTEMLLQFKMEDALELAESVDKCRMTIKGQKIWRDGKNFAGKRPSFVKINLLRDDKVYDSITIDSTGDGHYSFSCLPVWKDSDHKYSYRVDEAETPAGYIKTIDGYNVINTIEPGSITISGTKKWIDSNNESKDRPGQITVHLLQNGAPFKSTPLASPPDAEDTADFSFPGVPQFDNEGNPFDYTVDEDEVEGYKKDITGLIITNTLANLYYTVK